MGVFDSIVAFFKRLLDPEPQQLGLPSPQGGRVPVTPGAGRPLPAQPAAPRVAQAVPATPKIGMGTSRRARIHDAFDTSMPVASRAGLAGRGAEMDRLIEAVLEHRKHAIVFGARGSGKTSLSRVFGDIADEVGCVVLYNLASGDIGFDALCRPYLAEMVGQPGDELRRSDIEPFMNRPFDARQLATLLADKVRRRTIFVLDEFDRVQSFETKVELASFMKLLSDMRSNVRILTVGIAANVEDLIEGHPSLRRHMVSIPVGGIGKDKLEELLGQCATRAGMTISAEASSVIAGAAVGSPYHLRLFGLHAALQAERAGVTHIDEEIARAGFAVAFSEWRQLSGQTADLIVDRLTGPAPVAFAIAVTCFTAAMKTRVDREWIVRELADSEIGGRADVVDEAIEALRPILHPSAKPGQFIFEDALAPQFYLLMYNGRIDPREADQSPRSELRSLLAQGVRQP